MRAFPYRSDCPISSTPAVEGSLIEDCEISSVPAPIWTNPVFQFYPPGVFEMGCFFPPDPSVDFKVGIKPSFSAWITYPSSEETGVCEPKFNFLVRLPGGGACPEMSTMEDEVYREDGTIPIFEVSTKNNEEEECKTDFRFSMGVPCVNIESAMGGFTFEEQYDPALNITFDVSLRSSSSSSSSSSWELTPECIYNPNFDFIIRQPRIDISAAVVPTTVSAIDPCDGGLKEMYIKSIDNVTYVPPLSPNGTGELTIDYTRGIPWGSMFNMAGPGGANDGVFKCQRVGWMGEAPPYFLKDIPTVTDNKTVNFELGVLTPEYWIQNTIFNYNLNPAQKVACNTAKQIVTVPGYPYGEDRTMNYLFSGADSFPWYIYKLWMPKDKWVFENSEITPTYFTGEFFTDQLCTAGFITKLSSTNWAADADVHFGTQINVLHTELSNFPEGGLITGFEPETWYQYSPHYKEGHVKKGVGFWYGLYTGSWETA